MRNIIKLFKALKPETSRCCFEEPRQLPAPAVQLPPTDQKHTHKQYKCYVVRGSQRTWDHSTDEYGTNHRMACVYVLLFG